MHDLLQETVSRSANTSFKKGVGFIAEDQTAADSADSVKTKTAEIAELKLAIADRAGKAATKADKDAYKKDMKTLQKLEGELQYERDFETCISYASRVVKNWNDKHGDARCEWEKNNDALKREMTKLLAAVRAKHNKRETAAFFGLQKEWTHTHMMELRDGWKLIFGERRVLNNVMPDAWCQKIPDWKTFDVYLVELEKNAKAAEGKTHGNRHNSQFDLVEVHTLSFDVLSYMPQVVLRLPGTTLSLRRA